MRRLMVSAMVLGLMVAHWQALAGDAADMGPLKKTFRVYFDFGEVNLTDAAAQVVKVAADTYASSGGVRIDIIGHTDTAESDKAKWIDGKDKDYAAWCKHISARERNYHPLCVWKRPNAVRLGLRRANSVADTLVKMGVPRTAIHVGSVGADSPMAPTPPATREPLNRFTEVTIR